jgi:CheY-like chemotaxis protein
LVVDDEPINGEIASILLEDAGFRVDQAEDGIQAVDMASKTAYGAVLMDMQMPRMDGLNATRNILLLPGYANVPIVATTGNAFAEDKARCLAAGMVDFITKPFLPEELYGKLLHHLVLSSGVSARSDLLTMRGIGYPDSSLGLARRAI